MPYFQRKPYLETMTEAAPKSAPPEERFADLARGVLAAETAPAQAFEGPFRVARPVAPGEEGRVTLSIAADDRGGPLTLNFSAEDLRGADGGVIPSGMIALRPERVTVRPGGSADVHVDVRPPRDAHPGVYRGRIVGTGTEPLTLLIEVEVAPAS